MTKFYWLIFLATWTFCGVAVAAENGDSSLLIESGTAFSRSEAGKTIYLETIKQDHPESESLLRFEAGEMKFRTLALSNSYYKFAYPQDAKTTAFSLGWENTPVRFYGHLGIDAEIAYASYQTNVNLGAQSQSSLHLNIVPMTLSAVYLADFHPIMKWLTPAIGAGVGYFAYFQSGDVDGVHSKGGEWTSQLSLGLRHNLRWMGLENFQALADYRITGAITSSNASFAGNAWLFGLAAKI